MIFGIFGWPNLLRDLARGFVSSFRVTFIFYASSSDFSVKSYGHLKFFHANFWQLQIYHYSLQCQDSSIKYPLNEIPTNPKLWSNQHIHASIWLKNLKYFKLMCGACGLAACTRVGDRSNCLCTQSIDAWRRRGENIRDACTNEGRSLW